MPVLTNKPDAVVDWKLKAREYAWPAASCTRRTKPKLPVPVGVPDSRPSDVNVSPGGSMSNPSDEGVIVNV